MDSVIADIYSVACQIIEEWTGKRYNKLMINRWDFFEKIDYGKGRTMLDFFKELWSRWNDIHPTEEHIGGKVGELMLLGQVDIVTSSDDHSRENRKKWVAKYHIPYSNFINLGYGKHKLDMDYDVWIDDAPYQAEAAEKAGKKLLLYTQPYNLEVKESANVKRIFSLSDARRLIKNGYT
jgi:hypothetical protein